ncbi:hypothetical protein HUU62_04285 [Rhodoferax sp. 4810]|nr:hypothetical protein [Rhodoferax jenense]
MSTTNTTPAKPLTAFTVEDAYKNDVLDIEATRPHGMCAASVMVSKQAGPLWFQVNLKPDTARAMAAALMILADTAEQFELEATLQAELAAEQAAA